MNIEVKNDLIKHLEELIVNKSRLCNNWSKSSDRGACQAYDVDPFRRMLKAIVEIEVTKDK